MSYEQHGPYVEESTAVTITATAADHGSIRAPKNHALRVLKVGYTVKTAVVAAGTTAVVISFDLSDADDSANRTELKTFTPENGTLTVNAQDDYDFTLNGYSGGYRIPAGRSLVFEHKTAAAGGSAAGVVGMYAIVKLDGVG